NNNDDGGGMHSRRRDGSGCAGMALARITEVVSSCRAAAESLRRAVSIDNSVIDDTLAALTPALSQRKRALSLAQHALSCFSDYQEVSDDSRT
ncbi:MAG: hypothetical protein KA775_04520, partial [Ottowia sp.]|nr:hypothetical protein [Ottowia sp.]